MKLILGKKLGMTTKFDEKGNAHAATVISAGPCFVTQVRSKDKDGYLAVQMGFGKAKSLTNPEKGHLKKVKIKDNLKFLTEMKVEEGQKKAKVGDIEVKPGDKIDVSIFKKDEKVDVAGRSKGKGFAGTIKRWNFARGPVTHGSHNIRQPGAIGQCSFPGRVFKGKKMAGRMGGAKVTTKNLKILEVSPEENIIMIKGAIPGPTAGL